MNLARFLLIVGLAAATLVAVGPAGAAAAAPSSPSQSFQAPTPDRSATPDEIITADGSVVEGAIETMTGGTLTLKTSFSQPVSFSQSKIVGVTSASTLEIVMYDSTVHVGTLATNADGAIVITPADGGAAITVQWADIAELYRTPVRWYSKLTMGLNENSGNTETLGFALGIETERKDEYNRISGDAHFTFTDTFGATIERKFDGALQFDHYIRPRLYVHITEEVLHDNGQDLSVRSASHVGIGYDVVERPHSLLSVEFGVGVLANRYDVDSISDDTNFSGRGSANLKIPFGHGITLTDDLVFYVHSELQSTNDLVVSFKLASAWSLQVTSKLQWNSDPSTLAEEWDHQTLLGVTYSF